MSVFLSIVRARNQLSSAAAIALGRIGLPAIAGFVELLADSDPEVRLNALNGLAEMGQAASSAVPQITKLLNDTDKRVCNAAVSLLGRIGPPAQSAIPALEELRKQPDLNPLLNNAIDDTIKKVQAK
ncbi:MAG: HEAT repeat domain-containing protein [Acidobacteriota bacterium]